MRLDYAGQRRFDDSSNDARFGVLNVSNAKETEKAEFIADKLREDGYVYDVFGDGDETAYWFTVEDRDDFDNLKECYKEAKKLYTRSKGKDVIEYE